MDNRFLLDKYPDSFLVQYYSEISAGRIIAGHELILFLDKLMEYLENEDYLFDTSDANKRIQFIEHECKHSISPFAGKPFKLELWQKALIEAIYSFKYFDETANRNVRLFKRALLLIARKNGKSSLSSALALAEFFCGELGVNILCASNDYDQASILFDEINNIREQSRSLERVTRKNIKGIFFGNLKQRNKQGKYSYQNKAKIRKLSARTGSKEGRNIDFAVVDEVHEMKSETLIMPIRQSMSTKLEPLLIEITTEGFTTDGYLDKLLVDARRVLNNEIERPDWLVWLCTQDDENQVWQDESTWAMSNPGLGTIKNINFLRNMINEAKSTSGTRSYVLAKDFNLKQNVSVAWLTYDQIHNEDRFSLEDFRGWYCIGGCDFAETTDLCSAVILIKDDVGRSYVYPHFWIPESKADIKINDGSHNPLNPEQRDYRRWASDGLITIMPGSEVYVADVADWFYSLYDNYKLTPFKVGYDNRFALEFRRRFEFLIGVDIAENVSQTTISLSEPMRGLEADLTARKVIHNDNPILTWNLANISVETDKNEYIKPRKNFGNSKNRIDGGAALLNAYAMLQRNRGDYMELIKSIEVEKVG